MTNECKWEAVLANDRGWDGRFFYGVRSTGIFCRPSCPSKPPLRRNVAFFDTAADALAAGFRPCKRCRPDLLDYQPQAQAAGEVKSAIDRHFADPAALGEALGQLGLSRRQMLEAFAGHCGQTPAEYTAARRIQAAKELLETPGPSALDIALAVGFESLSAFYRTFHTHTGLSPGEYRRQRARVGEGAAANPGQSLGSGSHCTYDLALGKVSIATDGSGITAIRFADGLAGHGPRRSSSLTDQAARQLEAYFAGQRRSFDLPLHPKGTPFQQAVWEALRAIPYGSTRSYGQVAALVGNPRAGRAVGMANNKNPILVVIPCHRVVGADGSLVGYAAPLEIKKRLLHLEQFGR